MKNPKHIEVMNKMGITVYLKASVDDLVSRLLASKNARPLIQGKSPYELKVFITHHLAERDIYYSQAMVVFEKNQEILLAHLNNNIEKVKIAKAIKEKIESFEVN